MAIIVEFGEWESGDVIEYKPPVPPMSIKASTVRFTAEITFTESREIAGIIRVDRYGKITTEMEYEEVLGDDHSVNA